MSERGSCTLKYTDKHVPGRAVGFPQRRRR